MCRWTGDLSQSTPTGWLARTSTVAVALRAFPQRIVVDCGCGRCDLRGEPGMSTREYVGLDANPVVPGVRKHDFDLYPVPAGLPGERRDRVVVAVGLLEYLDCPAGFILSAADVADAMLFTYAPTFDPLDIACGRTNWHTVREVFCMASLGWAEVQEVARGTHDEGRTMFIACRRPLRRPVWEAAQDAQAAVVAGSSPLAHGGPS